MFWELLISVGWMLAGMVWRMSSNWAHLDNYCVGGTCFEGVLYAWMSLCFQINWNGKTVCACRLCAFGAHVFWKCVTFEKNLRLSWHSHVDDACIKLMGAYALPGCVDRILIFWMRLSLVILIIFRDGGYFGQRVNVCENELYWAFIVCWLFNWSFL